MEFHVVMSMLNQYKMVLLIYLIQWTLDLQTQFVREGWS
jgi:hypothetical protein